MITGITSNKLDIVSTYGDGLPFVVGINGVTKIEYTDANLTGITKVYYTIDNINYVTDYGQSPDSEQSYPTTFYTNSSGFDPNPKNYTLPKYNFGIYPYIKEEDKMGMVFPPKINNDLFIDRMSLSVFERHSRLGETKNLVELIDYRNGYYNIVLNF